MPNHYIRYHRNCKTCQVSKGNERLRHRILHTKFNRQPGEETLKQLAEEIGITEAAFLAHCKNHLTQASANTLEIQKNRSIEKMKVDLQKQAELAIDHDSVVPETDFERGLTETIALGADRMKKGHITVSTTQYLQALKIKADYSGKKRGQDAELIKTMYRMVSGDKHGPEESTSPAPAGKVVEGRTNGPSGVHQSSAWDAIARRTAEISKEYPIPQN